MALKLRKGGHRDLEKYYTLMEMDFDSAELLPKMTLHRAISRGSVELLMAYDDESNLDVAYALTFPEGMYNYVLLKYIGVLPWYREHGMGIETMRMINRRYAEKQGIVAEIAEFEDDYPDHIPKLLRLAARFGFEETDVEYAIAGTKTHLMVKPLKGTADIKPVAGRIMADFYTSCVPFEKAKKIVTMKVK